MPTPATVYLSESNGAGETVTDNITSLAFGTKDAPNIISAQYPIVIPGTSFAASFKKWERVRLAALGDSNQIAAIRYWQSGGTGITCQNGLGTSPFYGIQSSASFVQNANGSTVPNNWVPYQTPNTALGFSIVGTANGSPFTFSSNGHADQGNIAGALGNDGSNPSVTIGGLDAGALTVPGTYSNYFFLAMTCGPSTTPNLSLSGTGGQPVITVQYNES